VRFHLDDQDGGRDDARRNIDAWWPAIAAGTVEAIVVTASGCGVQVKDYGHLLKDDPRYADKAARVSALCRDVAEVLGAEAARLEPLLGRRRAPAAAHRLSCPVQPAARPEDPRRRRGAARRRGFRARAGPGRASVLRFGGHLFAAAAGDFRRLRDDKLDALQGRGRIHRLGEHRLHRTSGQRGQTTCPALGRAPL
jgi:glycolate oxidase iron-sulfur subunit